MDDFQKLYSAKLVADLFEVSEGTVWRLAAAGTIPAPIKISPGVTRWDALEIGRFLESKKRARLDASATFPAPSARPGRNPVPPSIRPDAKRPGRPRKIEVVA
jgi:predicted DNA-binding transcriptional regulator AlpA